MKNRKGYKKGGMKLPSAPVLIISDKGKGTAGPRPGMGRPIAKPSKPATGGIKPLKASDPRPGMGRPMKPRPGTGGPRAEMSRLIKRQGRAEGGMVDFGSIFEMEKKSGK